MSTQLNTAKILLMKSIKSYLSESKVLLILVILFSVVTNVVWHIVNNAPPTWDSAGHLGLSFLFADTLPELLFGEVSFTNFLRISNYYPPLVQLLGGFSILIFGRHYFSAIFIGTVFLAISIFYLYKIVMMHYQDEKLAALTVFIYALFPHVWEQSRQFHLDVPLVALILAAYYYLVQSDSLKNKKNSLLFFIFFVLAQLTKWYGFVYLVVPFAYEVIGRAIKEKDLFNKERLTNVFQGAFLIIFLAIPWYVANYSNIVNIVSITSQGEVGDPENVLSLESLFHYLKLIMSHQITFVSVLLLFFSIYMFAKRQMPHRKYIFNLLIVPYFVFSLIQNKDLRYVLPLTPIFAFYISYTLLRFEMKYKANTILKYLYPTYLMGLLLFLSFNQFKMLPDNLKPIAYIIGGPYYHGWYYEPYVYAANIQDWKNNQIIKEIEQMAQAEPLIQDHYKVLELSDNRYYSLASFEMFRRQNGFEEMEIVVPYFQFEPFAPDELQDYLRDIHFALVPANPGPSGLRNIAVLNQLATYFKSDLNNDFSLVTVYNMPDGNVLSLYKRANFLGYANPNIREDSLRIGVGNILFLDRTKTEGLPFKVFLYDGTGQETVIDVVGGGSQRRIALDNIKKFRIDLPLEQQDVRDLRGWTFEEGIFNVDPDYSQVIIDSGNEYIYDNYQITPRAKYFTFNFRPRSLVRFTEDGIRISLEPVGVQEGQKVFVAYATEGWQWNNIWLEGENREITIPTSGLLQLEVSQRNQLIVGFPTTWGFFPCYDGRAVCYYPLVEGL